MKKLTLAVMLTALLTPIFSFASGGLYIVKTEDGQVLLSDKPPETDQFTSWTNKWMPKDEDVSSFFIAKTNIRNSKWIYRTTFDEVEQKTSTVAILKSTNAINMGLGQGGSHNLYIAIKNIHDTGFYNDEIFIGYNNALVDVCLNSCVMRARFNNTDANSYLLDYLNPNNYKISNEPNILDLKYHDTVALKDDDFFLLNLYNSENLIVNFPNFDGKTYTYRFDLTGLDVKKMGVK